MKKVLGRRVAAGTSETRTSTKHPPLPHSRLPASLRVLLLQVSTFGFSSSLCWIDHANGFRVTGLRYMAIPWTHHWPQEILAPGSLPTCLSLCLCEREENTRYGVRYSGRTTGTIFSLIEEGTFCQCYRKPIWQCLEVLGSHHQTCLWLEGKKCSVMLLKGSDATWIVWLITL